jgi:hypothetical protein
MGREQVGSLIGPSPGLEDQGVEFLVHADIRIIRIESRHLYGKKKLSPEFNAKTRGREGAKAIRALWLGGLAP